MSGRACPEGLIDSPSGPVRNRLNRRRNQSGRRENSREAGGSIHHKEAGLWCRKGKVLLIPRGNSRF